MTLSNSPSTLRKLADSISDPKYEGVKVTRKQMMESDEDDDNEDSAHGNVPDGDGANSAAELSENEQDLLTAPSGRTQSGASHSPPTNVSLPAHSEDDVLATTLKRTREEERKKGKAVARQLVSHSASLVHQCSNNYGNRLCTIACWMHAFGYRNVFRQ